MKRLLSLILVLALCVSVFASCEYLPKFDFDFGFGKDNNDDENKGTPPVEEPPVQEKTDLEKALEYIHQMYKDMAEVTAANYDLLTVAPVGDTTYTVTWTVSDERVTIATKNETTVTVVIPESDEDFTYVLKATVTGPDGASLSKEYSHKVNKFAYTTFAQYVEAAENDPVVVTGVITGIISKSTGSNANGFYMQDENNEGGYYIYSFSDKEYDPVTAGLKVGQTVKVKGNKAIYNGTHEVKSAAVEVIDETINLVTPVNYTSILSAAASLSDETLVYKQGMLVTINGVTVLEAGDNGYYYFGLDDHKVYLRISSSANPTDKTSLDAVKAAHAANYGNIATVTGVISIYGGNFYLTPVSADAFSDIQVVKKSAAEMVAIELAALSVQDKVNTASVLELATVGQYYEDVKISWVSDNALAVVGENGLTVTLGDAETVVKLTATLTCEDVTETKEFSITVAAKPNTVPVAVDAPVAGTAYKIHMVHPNADMNGIGCYLTGAAGNKEYYLATTELATEAADIYLEATEGGFHLYLMNGETKVYLNIRENGTYVNNLYEAEAKCVYTYDATLKAMVTVVGENTYTFGMKTTSTYTTIEAKKVTDTACAFAQLVAMVEVGPHNPAELVAGTAYKIHMVHPNADMNGLSCYLTGLAANKEYYLATTDDILKAADIYLEATEGGFHLYLMNGETKVYLNIRKNGTYVNNLYEAEAQCVYTYDATLKTMVTVVDGETYTFGMKTTSTYTTIEAKKVTDTACAFASFVIWVGPLPEVEAEPPIAEGETKASLDLVKAGTDNAWNDTTKYLSHSVDENVTLTFAGGNNTGKFYSDGIRLYATDTPPATITVSVAEGYELVSIKFVTVTGTYAFICSGSDTTADLSNTVISVSGSTVTFNTVKNGSNGKQVRLQSIEVVYKAVEKAEA